ncbi:MAG TPA: lysylphosphatidylglycerol synthase domain-containing protein [Longimicrobiales bacterium]
MAMDLRRAGRGALIALSFVFLGALLVRQREQLAAYPWQVRPFALGLSILGFAAVLVASVGIWGRTLKGFGVRIPFPVLARIWFLSNLSRYIPGKIWQFVGVAELSRAAGLSALTNVTSLLVFMGITLVAACFVGAYLMPATGPLADIVVALRIAAPFLLLLLHPAVIGAGVRWASRITRRPLARWDGSWLDGLLLFGLCVLEWLGMGAAFTLFMGSVAPVGAAALPAATAAFALSFVAGYVVLLPAGLGAKEGALAVLLGTVVPLPVAAAVAVAARVWTILAELLPVCIFLRPTRWRAPAGPAAESAESGPTTSRAARDGC